MWPRWSGTGRGGIPRAPLNYRRAVARDSSADFFFNAGEEFQGLVYATIEAKGQSIIADQSAWGRTRIQPESPSLEGLGWGGQTSLDIVEL